MKNLNLIAVVLLGFTLLVQPNQAKAFDMSKAQGFIDRLGKTDAGQAALNVLRKDTCPSGRNKTPSKTESIYCSDAFKPEAVTTAAAKARALCEAGCEKNAAAASSGAKSQVSAMCLKNQCRKECESEESAFLIRSEMFLHKFVPSFKGEISMRSGLNALFGMH